MHPFPKQWKSGEALLLFSKPKNQDDFKFCLLVGGTGVCRSALTFSADGPNRSAKCCCEKLKMHLYQTSPKSEVVSKLMGSALQKSGPSEVVH